MGPLGHLLGPLLEIPCEPNGRKLAVSKLPDDFIPAIENIPKKHRVVTSRSVFFHRFYIIIDALKSSLAGHSQDKFSGWKASGVKFKS